MTDISRRDFLKIVLGTVATTAFIGPTAALWPEEARSRPVAEPWCIDIDGGYLLDEAWVDDDWPTYRDFWDYDRLPVDEKIERLLDLAGYDENNLYEECQITKPRGGWHERALARIEAEFDSALDDPVDPEMMGGYELMWRGPYAAGALLLEQLPVEEHDRLGLWLVEGECPGNDFCGVRFDGDVDRLNEALARHGINAIVRAAA